MKRIIHLILQVTLFYDKLSPNTTGDISAGWLLPFKCDGEDEKIARWFKQTFDWMAHLYKKSNSIDIGNF